MNKIAVIPNEARDYGLQETNRVIRYLANHGKNVLVEQRLKQSIKEPACFLELDALMAQAQAAVILGGDGTLLGFAPLAAKYQVPILGINLGHLGFLAQAEKGDIQALEDLCQGRYHVDSCMMLNCCIRNVQKELTCFTALNDIIITGDGAAKMITVTAAVNGTEVGTYSADGLIAATAVGSTAYSLSAGGAILHPSLDAVIITPICPHTLKARSMVVPGGMEICLKAVPPYRSKMAVLADGKQQRVLEAGEEVHVTKSSLQTLLIKPENRNFFDVLREKLSD